jgi:hypothetical protein
LGAGKVISSSDEVEVRPGSPRAARRGEKSCDSSRVDKGAYQARHAPRIARLQEAQAGP